ncbi:Fumarate hydratase class II [Trichinella spiralis]|uniref:Fumarate hydratase class II n=1 Tax=Trichinella spiralis TaxID=6334 RepID=A0ABR3KC75_TRISP
MLRCYEKFRRCLRDDSWVEYFRSSFSVVVSKQRGNGRRDKADNSGSSPAPVVNSVAVLYAGLVNVHTVCCCFPFGTVHSEHKDFNYSLTKIRSLVRPRPSGPSSGLGSTLGLGGASDPPPLPPPHFQPGLARLCCLAGSSAAVVPVPPVSSNFWRQSVHACSRDRHVLCAASCGQCRACQRRMLLLDRFGRLDKRRLFHFRIV